jgi:hypothetical protein
MAHLGQEELYAGLNSGRATGSETGMRLSAKIAGIEKCSSPTRAVANLLVPALHFCNSGSLGYLVKYITPGWLWLQNCTPGTVWLLEES